MSVACILLPRTLYRRSIILWHNEFVSFTCSQDAFVSWKWNFDWFDSMTNNISASDLFSSILKRDIPDSTLKPFASIGCWFFFCIYFCVKFPYSHCRWCFIRSIFSYMQLRRNFFFVVSYFDDDQYSVVRLLLMWLDRSQVAKKWNLRYFIESESLVE